MRTTDLESVRSRWFAFRFRKFRLSVRSLMFLVGLSALILGGDIALTNYLNAGMTKRIGPAYRHLAAMHEFKARFCRSASMQGLPYDYTRFASRSDDPDTCGVINTVYRFSSWMREADYHDRMSRIFLERLKLWPNRERWFLWPF